MQWCQPWRGAVRWTGGRPEGCQEKACLAVKNCNDVTLLHPNTCVCHPFAKTFGAALGVSDSRGGLFTFIIDTATEFQGGLRT